MPLELGEVIDGRYRVLEEIGSGGFGNVYSVRHIQTRKLYAMKTSGGLTARYLELEYRVYRTLDQSDYTTRIPKSIDFTTHRHYKCLVMPKLGRSVDHWVSTVGGKVGIKTLANLAFHVLRALWAVHHESYIHCDIKPKNMLVGMCAETETRIFLIDFGIAKLFRDPSSKVHFRPGTTGDFTGTAAFASINCHKGSVLSRRDDLISLVYVLSYCAKGRLPWSRFENNLGLVERSKEVTSTRTLMKHMPKQFKELADEIMNLRFCDVPNYKRLTSLMKKVVEKENRSKTTRRQPDFEWMSHPSYPRRARRSAYY